MPFALTEGQLGYVISQAIGNERPARPVATLLTRVTVDGTDGAMARPSKPIGPPEAERRIVQPGSCSRSQQRSCGHDHASRMRS